MMDDKLRKKMREEAKILEKERAEQSKFEKFDMFKPAIGNNIIRILPHWDKPETELFYVKRKIHFISKRGNNGQTYNAPIRCKEDDCKLCKAYNYLKAKNSKKVDDFKWTIRFIYNILDYGIQNKQKIYSPCIKVYPAPVTIHGEIMEYFGEEEEDFCNIKKGRDWRLKKKVDPKKSAKYGTSYLIRAHPNVTAIPEKLMDLLSDMVNLDNIYNEDDDEAVMVALKRADVDIDDLDSDEDVEKPKTEKKKSTAKKEDDLPDFDDDSDDIEIPFGETDETNQTNETKKDDDTDLGIDTEGDSEIEEELHDLGL